MELGTAIASARATFELLRLAVLARDDAKLQAATYEMNEKLRAMSETAMAYVEKNAALVSENAELKLSNAVNLQAKADIERRLRDRENYVLHEIRTGAFVYAPKPGVQGHETPAHYLCQNCYDKGVKSVLRLSDGSIRWVCAEVFAHAIGAY